MLSDSRLLLRYGDLLLYRVHTLQIRQQQPTPSAFCHDDAVPGHIQLLRRGNLLRLPQHIDADRQTIHLPVLHGRESGILRTGADSIVHDLFRKSSSDRTDRSNTASEPSVLFHGHKRTRPAFVQFLRQPLGHLGQSPRLHKLLDSVPRQPDVSVFPFPPRKTLLPLLLLILLQKIPCIVIAAGSIGTDAIPHPERSFIGKLLCLHTGSVKCARHDSKGTMSALCRLLAEIFRKLKQLPKIAPAHHIHDTRIVNRSLLLITVWSILL